MALAGKSPPPPPPPPPASAPNVEPLNADPNVHWFAAWHEQTAPAPADFYPVPSNVGGVPFMQTQLNASAAIPKPLGIRVETPLSTTDANSLFNSKYPMPSGPKAISYVFGAIDTGTSAAQTTIIKNLVSQVRGSTWSKNAYVGQSDLVPLSSPDNFRRGPLFFTESQYKDAKVNMANTELYPGDSTNRNKSTNDWANANIRTGLFVAPVGRMTAVQDKLDSSYKGTETLTLALDRHKQIPYVTRFNNWGNSSLDTDQNPANGYAFVPGAPLNNGYVNLTPAQTANQMMGQGDFSAQIFHYRSRGAYSVKLFSESAAQTAVVGYTGAQAEQDVRDGWFGGGAPIGPGTPAGTGLGPIAHANNIFGQTDNKRATMTLNPIIDGTSANAGMRAEQTGTLWSGVYSLSLKQLDILASNLDTSNHLIKFGTVDVYDVFCVKNGSGYTYADNANVLSMGRNALVEAGMHRLLQFDLVTTRVYNSQADYLALNSKYSTKTIWLLNQNYVVFNNNNRNDVGIPEPTTFGILAAAGSLGMICRRHRSKKTA